MPDRIERELVLPASPEELWSRVTSDGWLAEEVRLDQHPGGEASFSSNGATKQGWVEDISAPWRLTFWWSADDEPASRVEITLSAEGEQTRLRVVESRPLDRLDLMGTPLPSFGERRFGPALLAR